MHIDWFVLSAQVINFLILVFLLKYLLYDRIVKAMETREKKITSRYVTAEEMKNKAEQAREEFLQKTAAFEIQREELLNQARITAGQHRQELMFKAGAEIDELRARWIEMLEQEKQSFLEDLRHRAGVQIFSTIRQILQELADTNLEERLLDMLEIRLKQMSEEQRLALLKNLAIADPDQGVLIRSGFALTKEQEDRVIALLEKYAPMEMHIRFETSARLIAGIEIHVHGHKIAWELSDYLSGLEESFEKILKEEIPDETHG